MKRKDIVCPRVYYLTAAGRKRLGRECIRIIDIDCRGTCTWEDIHTHARGYINARHIAFSSIDGSPPTQEDLQSVTACPKHPNRALLLASENGIIKLFCPECGDTVPDDSGVGKVLRQKYRKKKSGPSSLTVKHPPCKRENVGSTPTSGFILSEADVKRAVDALCEFAQNQGKGIYVRLFTGDLLMRDETGRIISRVRGCAMGTPDRLWIASCATTCRRDNEVTWLELKRPKNGHQSPEQIAFQAMVEAQGCRYLLVTDVAQVQEIIG